MFGYACAKVSRRFSRFELAGSPVRAKNVNFCEKTHAFRPGGGGGWGGGHVCELCEKDACFPRVEFAVFPNNSLNFNEKRTHSLNVHEKRTFSEKGCHLCEFCEKDARFPRV